MAVLKEVYELSNNTKFNGWCVKSRTKIADSLDLSRQCIITCLNTLQMKGYVEYNKDLGMCKPTDMIREIAQERENIGILIKTEGYEIMSMKLAEMVKSMNPKNNNYEQKNDAELGCKDILQVSKKSTEVSKKLTPSVKKIDTYSISYSISDNNIYTNEEKNTLQVDISFDDFWFIYSSMLTDDNIARKKQTLSAWEKLNTQEKQTALDYACSVKKMKTPKVYVKTPDKLLRLKEFNAPPHEHIEKNKHEVNLELFKYQPKEEVMKFIINSQVNLIKSYRAYLACCNELGNNPLTEKEFFDLK